MMHYRRAQEAGHAIPDDIGGVTPAIILIDPKYARNVGQILRLASCYGIKQVWFTGQRVSLNAHRKGYRLPREERMRGYNDVILINYDRPFDQFERNVPKIGVEFNETAQLPTFAHPEDAVYVFGPEDGSIPKVIRHLCWQFVSIPTLHCLNLSIAVGTVLYDRMAKGHQLQDTFAGLQKFNTAVRAFHGLK